MSDSEDLDRVLQGKIYYLPEIYFMLPDGELEHLIATNVLVTRWGRA